MLIHRLALLPLLVALCSCGARVETLDLDSDQLRNSLSEKIRVVMDTVPTTQPAAPSTSSSQQTMTNSTDNIAKLQTDYVASNEIFLKCLSNPRKCDTRTITASGTPQRTSLSRLIREYSAANIRTQNGSGVFLVRIDSLSVVDSATAVINTCTFDSLVMVDAGKTNSKQDDIIFNDTVLSYLTELTLKIDDGKWKWASELRTMTKFNFDQCGLTKP